jgi:hypothetical protein
MPADRKINVFCQVGLRGYLASRILKQNGYTQVFNLSGGYRLYRSVMMDRSGEIPFDCYGQPASDGEGERLAVPQHLG